MHIEDKQLNKEQRPVTEKEIRKALDLLPMDDECQGWRSMKQITQALSDIEPNQFQCKRMADYWFSNYNQQDRFFETSFIDGEWCFRSHKFNLCRDRFLKTIKDYQMNVIRYPEQEPKLKRALSLELRAALQPSITARKQLKKAYC